jgi:Na+/alanine symporter
MAIPNLISMLVLSNVIVAEVKRFQPTIIISKTAREDEEDVA